MPAKKTVRLALLAAVPLTAAGIGPAVAAAAQQSFTTAGEHAFVVPVAVTSVQATLVGGNGGAGSPGSTNQADGGRGASVRATLAVTPGQTLYAQVAGNGLQSGLGGFGGGGAGGPVVLLFAGAPGGGGGGGASAIRPCAAAGCAPLVVAGGGGGGGGAGRDATPTINGGDGGPADMPGLDGEQDFSKKDAGGGGGKAGTATAGGAAGAHSWGAAAQAGSLAAGGAGGTSLAGGGGGGGGGLFGGGGGGAGEGFADFATYTFLNGGGGGGGGGASGVPAGAAGVSNFSLLPATPGGEPSVTFSWTPPAPAASTGAVTVTGTTATLAGTVNPNLSPVSDCHFTIAPATSAGASIACAQQLGAGADAEPVSAAATNLAPATSYTVRLVAANAQGATEGEAVTFTTGTSSAPATGLRVSGLQLSPARFRRGARAGTTVTFSLSAAAAVKLGFERAAPGRVSDGRCVRATRALRHGARCTRFTRVRGAVRIQAPAGAARIQFKGVLDGGRRLARGAYRLSLVAVDAAGQAAPARHARFKVLA